MRKIIILSMLFAILLIAGCAKKSAGDSNNTTAPEKSSEKPLFGSPKADFAKESAVLETLNKSEPVKLFLGLYPEAKPVLTKNEEQEIWIATYEQSGKNLTLTLDSDTTAVLSSSIDIQYLRGGKYCKVDADCVNIGSSASALCINFIYATKEGTPAGKATCYEGVETCGCVSNSCTKKSIPADKSLCTTTSSNTSSSTPASTPVSSGSSVACSSISELRTGQKAASGNKTLEFISLFQDSGEYGAKLKATSSAETSTKYLKPGAKEYIAAGITVSVSDVIVEVGGGSGIAALAITGMEGTCTIS